MLRSMRRSIGERIDHAYYALLRTTITRFAPAVVRFDEGDPLLGAGVRGAIRPGTFAPRRVALAITGVASALTLFAFTWTVADGQGDDPVWVIGVAVVGCGIAVALADALSRRRVQQKLGA